MEGGVDMITIHAHFDGAAIIPDEPVDLPLGRRLVVSIDPDQSPAKPNPQSALRWLSENALPAGHLPSDLSSEHDHYLYGSPKRNG